MIILSYEGRSGRTAWSNTVKPVCSAGSHIDAYGSGCIGGSSAAGSVVQRNLAAFIQFYLKAELVDCIVIPFGIHVLDNKNAIGSSSAGNICNVTRLHTKVIPQRSNHRSNLLTGKLIA